MIKRKYIKKLYIEEAYRDKCGGKLVPDTYILMSNPPQYPYICSKCDEKYIFKENEKPDTLRYEFEEEKEEEKLTKKYKVLALIGEAGTGKDTILKRLVKRFDLSFYEIVSYTTRPKRSNETAGEDYYFLTDNEFSNLVEQGKMLEHTEFNGWHYGTGFGSLNKEKINIGVFNPEGIRKLKENPDIDLKVWRITCPEAERLKRQLEREENPNIEEIFRRYKTDKEDFDNLDFDYISIENAKSSDLETIIEIFKLYLDDLD